MTELTQMRNDALQTNSIYFLVDCY